MADAAKFLNLADRLINANGRPMTLVRVHESGAINVKTGKRDTEKEYRDFIGVCTEPTLRELQAGYFQGVTMCVLVAGDAIPDADLTDYVLIDGTSYNIREIRRVMPGLACILYKLGLLATGKIDD